MAQKKANAKQANEIRAAWNRVRQALTRAEASMTALVNANKGLLRALGKAGASVRKQAQGELNARIKKLEGARKNARKQLDALTRRVVALTKRTPARRPARKARRR